jgi:hypothetical protein
LDLPEWGVKIDFYFLFENRFKPMTEHNFEGYFITNGEFILNKPKLKKILIKLFHSDHALHISNSNSQNLTMREKFGLAVESDCPTSLFGEEQIPVYLFRYGDIYFMIQKRESFHGSFYYLTTTSSPKLRQMSNIINAEALPQQQYILK